MLGDLGACTFDGGNFLFIGNRELIIKLELIGLMIIFYNKKFFFIIFKKI